MGLMDVIRRAEESSKTAARHGMDAARHGWQDTERLVRRSWRVKRDAESTGGETTFARTSRTTAADNNKVEPAVPAAPVLPNVPEDPELRTGREFEDAERKAIVSI